MIHIVFGEAATGSVRHAFRKTDDEVIGFPADLSIGPLRAIERDEGIGRYFGWIQETLHPMFREQDRQEAQFRVSRDRLQALPTGAEVTIWTGENAAEQVGLRLACLFTRNQNLDIRIVNTYWAMRSFHGEPGVTVDIRHSGELSAEQILVFYRKDRKSLPNSRRQALVEEAEVLLRSDGLVRSWENGSLIEKPEARDDALILSCAARAFRGYSEDGWVLAVRVLGEAMA